MSTPPNAPPSPGLVDLRSDTVTRPTAEMRRAMANAEVGDDVYGEDPSVNRLQDKAAELLGTESALFVPSGTMANQIAIKVLTQPGDDMLVGHGGHNMLFEGGAAGALAGIQQTVIGEGGTFTAENIEEGCKPDNHHFAPTTAVSFENTHNMAGGVVWEPAQLARSVAKARELGLATHLDGARLWNAAARLGAELPTLTRGFDTVSVCLSKGLGAPVGSLVCGSKERVYRGHRVRKMYGGAMRQAGILAAGAIYALEHHRGRLTDDHENAAYLATELAQLEGVNIDLEGVHTNIVMMCIADEIGPAQAIADRAAEDGVLFQALGPRRIRLVTHLDVAREQCTRAIEVFAGASRRS